MVNKAVAGVGTACVAAGAVISALVLTQENFVVVKLPGTESCSGEGENLALGQLSVVTASFNPQCTEGSSQSASFGQLKTIESGPILDFWPLFPAQALFGGNLGADDAGLEFTTCQEFYESNATLDFAKDLVVGRVTQGFPTLNASIVEGYQTATTSLKGGLDFVNTLLQGLWGSDIIPTVITGLDAGVTNNTQVQGLVTAGLAGLAQQLAVSLDQVLTDEKIGEIGAIAADDSSPLQPTAQVVAGGLVAGCNTAGTLQGTMAPFQAEGVKEAQIKEVVCWTNFFSQNVLEGDSPEVVAAKEQLGGAVFVLNQCSDDTATVTSCGTDTNLANTLPQNLKGPWAFCIITASAENALELTLPTTGDCSAEYLLNAADLTPLVGDSPLAAQLPLFQALPSLCGDKELDDCYLGENPEEAAKGFPALASFSAYSPMCLATSISLLSEGAPLDSLPTCESFQDFLEITAATSPDAAAVIALYVTPCIKVATAIEVADPFNNGQCDAFVAQAAATGESRTTYAVLGLNNLNVDGDNIEAIVASCEDDELDRAAISTAGTLLPISIASEGVAFLLAVGAVATNKRSLAMIASVLALLGAVLTVVALLGVQGAPVYASVGGDPVIGTPQYVQGLGTTLAYVAALAPLVGSIMLGGASCCQNEDPDEVALTSKVDNSY